VGTALGGSGSGGTFSAWQFPISSSYSGVPGALPATQVTDAVATSGSATVTSASGGFANAVAGQPILVAGAGPSVSATHSTFVGTILTVNSATSITLSANAGNTTTAPNGAIYGPDATLSIRAAVTAANAYAVAHGYYAEVITPPFSYMVAGAPVVGGSSQGNAQIPLPFGVANAPKLILTFSGTQDASHLQYFGSSLPEVTGSSWICARSDGTPNGANGYSSVLGGPTAPFGFGPNTSVFSNIMPLIKGLEIVVPWNSTYCGFDFICCSEANVDSAAVLAYASTTQMGTNNSENFTNFTFGCAMPGQNNNDDSNLYKYSAEGIAWGLVVSEHTYAATVRVLYCFSGILAQNWTSGPMPHSALCDYVSAEACVFAVNFANAGGLFPLTIAQLDSENTFTAHVGDSTNLGVGTITINSFGQAPSVAGAANMTIINMRQTQGFIAFPVYALGTAFQNPTWRPVTVYLNTGTTTNIQIGPTSAAATQSVATVTTSLVMFRLPSGWWVNITGTVKPTFALWQPE
jgi:hypothetical protein